MNISRFFIDRPIFAGVLSALFLLAGIVGLLKLPVSEYPPVVPPSVVVHAQYPGATPKLMAETVAAPLEEQINGVENMLYMQSLSSNDGHLYLTVTFRLGTDPDKAQQFVENRVSQALPRLPEDVQRLAWRRSRVRRPSRWPSTSSRPTIVTTSTTSVTSRSCASRTSWHASRVLAT
jgi:multidrug efflux pump